MMTLPTNKIQYDAWNFSWSRSPPEIERGLREIDVLVRQLFGKNFKEYHLSSSSKDQGILGSDLASFYIEDPFLFLSPDEIPAKLLDEENDPLRAEELGRNMPFEKFAQLTAFYRFLWPRKDLMPRVRDALIAQRVIDLKRSPNHFTHEFSLFDQMQNQNLPTLKGFLLSCAIPIGALGITTMLAGICGVIWLSYWGLKIASIRRNSAEIQLKDRMLIDVTKDIEAAEALLNAVEHVKASNCSWLIRFFHEKILGDANPLERIDLIKQYAKENKVQYVEPSWARNPRMSKVPWLTSIQLCFGLYYGFVIFSLFLHHYVKSSVKPNFPIAKPVDDSAWRPLEKCVYYAKSPAKVFQCIDKDWKFTNCEKLKSIYHKMARLLHPDKVEGREYAFQQLSNARDWYC